MKDRFLNHFQIHYRHQRQGSTELWVLMLLMVLFVGSLLQVNMEAHHPTLTDQVSDSSDHLGVNPGALPDERLPQSPAVGY